MVCIVMACGDVVGCQRFGGPCCLHLQGEVIFRFSQRLRFRSWSSGLWRCVMMW